jgi:hypothetical protein
MNGKIYAIGGFRANYVALSSVEQYDPETDTWTMAVDMPTARWGLSTCAVNSKVYAIGGRTAQGGPFSTVEEYDLSFPPPDFNGDGKVDINDLLRVVESWGQDNLIVDIAPAFGDGVVDRMDLELLMSFWQQPVDDSTLIAHWALDEAEGDVAYDSAGLNDASVIGNPIWQPSAGQVNGAIQLDGFDDCLIASSPINVAESPFSLMIWIKGGAPGQAIISEPSGSDWLSLDPQSGYLMTELKEAGRSGGPLLSQAVVTDGNWRRIGYVWDGMYRTLYVDDIAVAEDIQSGLQSNSSGFYIGTGKTMAPGTYFEGFIDDVRIYNRAIRP